MGYIQELRTLIGNRPLITVSAGVLITVEEGKILLQQRTDNGLWGIPGGSMELGETLEETARREVKEETGLEVGELSLFGVFSGKEFFITYPNGDQVFNVAVIFTTSAFKGDLKSDESETLRLDVFNVLSLPSQVNPHDEPILKKFIAVRKTQCKQGL